MTRVQFWILNLFSVALAGLIGFEIFSSNKLDEAQSLERQAQIPVMQAGQVQTFARRMIERTAQGVPRDPALKDLLAKYGFHVTVTPVGSAAGSAPAPASPPGPNPVTTTSNP